MQGTEARTAFRTPLLAAVGLDLAGWKQYLTDVKTYRDHFVLRCKSMPSARRLTNS